MVPSMVGLLIMDFVGFMVDRWIDVFQLAFQCVNQGEEVLKETVFVLRGAGVLREAAKVVLSLWVRSSGEVRAGSRGRALDNRSESWRASIDLVFRKVRISLSLG